MNASICKLDVVGLVVKREWLGHEKQVLSKLSIEGRMFGRRVVGRKQTGIISDLMHKLSNGELKRCAEDVANCKLGFCL